MSNTIVEVFSSAREAAHAARAVREKDPQAKITIISHQQNQENRSLKLDGVISGVSSIFIPSVPLVNPMSTVGLPPQSPGAVERTNYSVWNSFDIDQRQAETYQKLIEEGKVILAVKSDNPPDKIKEYMLRS